jgi:hypothetical protein
MATTEPERDRVDDERLRHGGSGGYGADEIDESQLEGEDADPLDPEEAELADEDEEGFPRGAEA